MKVNRSGITRIVLEFNTIVIKVPNFSYSWQHFLKGLIANISENSVYKYSKIANENVEDVGYWKHEKKWQMLCPVKWCSWGGWILVMKRANMIKHEEEVKRLIYFGKTLYSYCDWVNNGFGGDDKYDNYGYIGNVLVKVDYP